MSFTQLDRRLQFLPLGLLWGVVAGGFHTYHIANMGSADDQVNWLVPIGTIACTCPITALLGSAILKRELSSIRWVVNWMITGVASCAGGVAIFHMTGFFLVGLILPFNSTLPSPTYFVTSVLVAMLIGLGFALIIGTVIAIESAVVALLLAPLSLLVRRLSRPARVTSRRPSRSSTGRSTTPAAPLRRSQADQAH